MLMATLENTSVPSVNNEKNICTFGLVTGHIKMSVASFTRVLYEMGSTKLLIISAMASADTLALMVANR